MNERMLASHGDAAWEAQAQRLRRVLVGQFHNSGNLGSQVVRGDIHGAPRESVGERRATS